MYGSDLLCRNTSDIELLVWFMGVAGGIPTFSSQYCAILVVWYHRHIQSRTTASNKVCGSDVLSSNTSDTDLLVLWV